MRSRRQTGGAHGFGTVHPRIIERSKGSNHGDAKRFLPTDEIARKDAPGALRVANAHHAGKPIDGRGQLGAILKNFASESLGEFDAARTAVVAARAVRYVSPTFEKHAAARGLSQIRMPPCRERRSGFVDYVEAPFQTDEVMPLQSVLVRDFDQRLRTMAGAAHEFFVRQRGMTDPAVHFEPDQLELRSGRKAWGKEFHCLFDAVDLRAALAADGDDGFGHSLGRSTPDCNGTASAFSLRIFEG